MGGWIFAAGMGLAVIVESRASAATSSDAAPSLDPHRGLATALATLTGLVLLAMTLLAVLRPVEVSPIALCCGMLFILGGVVLRAAAIRRLGSRFRSDNAAPDDAAFEQGGIYRCLAHPSEVGLLALAAAGPVLVPTPLFLALLGALVLLQIPRLHLEEKALFSRYGAVYRRYRQRTLDPFPSVFLLAGGRRK